MKHKILFLLLSLLFFLPVKADDSMDSIQTQQTKYIKGAVPEGDEEIYKIFVDKVTQKEKKEFLKKNKMQELDPYERTFELEYSKRGVFPVILSHDLDDVANALDYRYGHFITHDDRDGAQIIYNWFLTGEEKAKKKYNDLLQNQSKKEYLILLGTLISDDGTSLKKERAVYLIDPKYLDREYRKIELYPIFQKQIALILVANEGKTLEYYQSGATPDEVAENYDDELIKFVLEPLYSN